jgi:DNA-binding MarR family transcriptional regulator
VYIEVMATATPLGTTGFLLSKVGQLATDRFADKLRPLKLRPKHCGLLAAVANAPSASQQQLGRALELVPSAIVAMIDDLEDIGAVRRVADPDNRRKHAIVLTHHGRSLLDRATKLAEALDRELLAPLSAAERATLARLLDATYRSARG